LKLQVEDQETQGLSGADVFRRGREAQAVLASSHAARQNSAAYYFVFWHFGGLGRLSWGGWLNHIVILSTGHYASVINV
jgi:hypothetical protein